MKSRQETQDHNPFTQAVGILRSGGIAVLPTDTVYGIVASALIPKAVERVFELRKRDRDKAVIVLIPDETALEQFSIRIDKRGQHFLRSVWPGKVSVVLTTADPISWIHLHRGTNGIAFRLPADPALKEFLQHTGPLIAPSANIAGEPVATTITTAKEYFGNLVDIYIDGGTRESAPSTLIRWIDGKIEILRQGAVQIDIPST